LPTVKGENKSVSKNLDAAGNENEQELKSSYGSAAPAAKTTIQLPFKYQVFLPKFNAAATTIQKLVRGCAGRRTAVQQRVLHQQEAQLQAAAVAIQARVRGWAFRVLHQPVYLLQMEQARIENRKQRELAEIQACKERKIRAIQDAARAYRAEDEAKSRQLDERIQMGKKIIHALQAENKMIRAKNKALESAILQLVEENEMLERESKNLGKTGKELTENMTKTHTENALMLAAVRKLEAYKMSLEEAIEKRDEFILYENRVGGYYLTCVQSLAVIIEQDNKEADLAEEIEEILEQHQQQKGHKGLEETEVDMVESSF